MGVRSSVCGVGCTRMLLAVCPGQLGSVCCVPGVGRHSVRHVGRVRMCPGTKHAGMSGAQGLGVQHRGCVEERECRGGATGHGVQGAPATCLNFQEAPSVTFQGSEVCQHVEAKGP